MRLLAQRAENIYYGYKKAMKEKHAKVYLARCARAQPLARRSHGDGRAHTPRSWLPTLNEEASEDYQLGLLAEESLAKVTRRPLRVPPRCGVSPRGAASTAPCSPTS